jgi:hypothetical protein
MIRIKQISRNIRREKNVKKSAIEEAIMDKFVGKRHEMLRRFIRMQISRVNTKKMKHYSMDEKVLSLTIYYNTSKSSYKYGYKTGNIMY